MGFTKNEQGEWVYRVDETTEFRRSYETAAWYSVIEVPAGDYPVRFRNTRNEEVDGPDGAWWAYATLDGRLTYDYLPTLYGGVKIGEGSTVERDEPAQYVIQSYAFGMTDKVAA